MGRNRRHCRRLRRRQVGMRVSVRQLYVYIIIIIFTDTFFYFQRVCVCVKYEGDDGRAPCIRIYTYTMLAFFLPKPTLNRTRADDRENEYLRVINDVRACMRVRRPH